MLLQISVLIESSYTADVWAYKRLLVCMNPKMSIEFKYTFKNFQAHLFFLNLFILLSILLWDILLILVLFAPALKQFVHFLLAVLLNVINKEFARTWSHFLNIFMNIFSFIFFLFLWCTLLKILNFKVLSILYYNLAMLIYLIICHELLAKHIFRYVTCVPFDVFKFF